MTEKGRKHFQRMLVHKISRIFQCSSVVFATKYELINANYIKLLYTHTTRIFYKNLLTRISTLRSLKFRNHFHKVSP